MHPEIAIFLLCILAVILPFVVADVLGKRRTARQHALLWVLTAAAERGVPLVTAIEAFARQGSGRFAQRLRWLSGMLSDGKTLPEALAALPGLVRDDALPIIQVGHDSGTLAGALRQVATARDYRRQLWLALAGKVQYLCMAVFFGSAILTFVMVHIVPAFEQIFDDFGAKFPPATALLIDISRFFLDYFFLFIPIFLAILLLLLYAALRYAGWIRWQLPSLGSMARRLDTAVILDALALAAEKRHPLQEAIEALAYSYHKASIRRRLFSVMRDLHRGEDWCQSLLRRGLIKRADLAVLQAAQRVGNLPWALHEVADGSSRRFAYRLDALVQVLYPLVILCFGALVLFVVVALFIPLVTLIQQLT